MLKSANNDESMARQTDSKVMLANTPNAIVRMKSTANDPEMVTPMEAFRIGFGLVVKVALEGLQKNTTQELATQRSAQCRAGQVEGGARPRLATENSNR